MPLSRSLLLATLLTWAILLGTVVLPASARCKTHSCAARHAAFKERRAWRTRFHHETPYWRSWVLATATCESRRRWHVNTGNGFFGGLQFTAQSAWVAGFHRLPHLTSSWEQAVRGIRFAQTHGRQSWPVCGS